MNLAPYSFGTMNLALYHPRIVNRDGEPGTLFIRNDEPGTLSPEGLWIAMVNLAPYSFIRCRNSLISPRSAPTLTGRTMMNLAASWPHLSRATGCHSLR
jgi:hypothetical protein